MEVCSCPTTPLRRSRPSSSSSFLSGASADQRMIEICSLVVSAILRNLFYAMFTFIIGVIGTTLGAMIGAMLGMKSERRGGVLHGAGIGAITGASFSLVAVKASVGFWHSYDDEPVSFLHFIEVMTSLVNPTLVYLGEKFGPGNRHGPVRNQVVGIDERNNPVQRFIDRKRGNASRRGSVIDKLSKTIITDRNLYDTSGNRISCSVCLEDFQVGEVTRRLPICQHMFHGSCIAKWRIRHKSCPLCRTNQ